jgi:hypothetical protein
MLTLLRFSAFVALAEGTMDCDQQDDHSSMMQLPPTLSKRRPTTPATASQLLVKVKSLAQTVKSEKQDPLRQCQGGWQSGDGTGEGSSERSIGNQDSQGACVAAVRAQCADANGATYVASTTECICEIGQQALDDAVAGKENCEFFAEGVDDVAIATATDALADLVTNILDTLQSEHEGATQLVETVFGSVITAREVPSVQNADEVTSLGETAERLRAAADAAHQAVEDCQGSLATWRAAQSAACSAWESHFESLASCSEACPCTTDSQRFYDSYVVWRNIMADGGGAEIERLHKDCRDATAEVDRLSGSDSASEDQGRCADLQAAAETAEAESALADHRYASGWHLHNQSCISLTNFVEVWYSTESELALELTQRNQERCVLQQVQCFIHLITTASDSGALLDDTSDCDDTTCEPFFEMDFPEVPASPECVECPGCRNFGGGDAVPYDQTRGSDQCHAECHGNFPGNDYCNSETYVRCLWDRGAWVNGGYWQIITPEPQNFVKFEISAPSGTNGFVKFSDDGEDWTTAGRIDPTGAMRNGDLEVEWSWEVGAHRYWRYQVEQRQPGNWMGNFKFFKSDLAQVVRDGDPR